MIRRPPRSTLSSSSAASDVYKRQLVAPATDALTCRRNDGTQHWCIIVFVRSGWYDNPTTIRYRPAAIQDIIGPLDQENYKVYAVPLEEAAPLRIAARVRTDGALLYICPHNPLRDRPLLEIEKLFEKTLYGAVMLVVILPEAASLDAAFQTNARCNNATTGMCHQADWSDWLCKLDTAVFGNLISIMPFMSVNTLREAMVWNSMLRRRLTTELLE